MTELIALGQAILFITLLLVGSYAIFILCLLFIKLTMLMLKFAKWVEKKLFNNVED